MSYFEGRAQASGATFGLSQPDRLRVGLGWIVAMTLADEAKVREPRQICQLGWKMIGMIGVGYLLQKLDDLHDWMIGMIEGLYDFFMGLTWNRIMEVWFRSFSFLFMGDLHVKHVNLPGPYPVYPKKDGWLDDWMIGWLIDCMIGDDPNKFHSFWTLKPKSWRSPALFGIAVSPGLDPKEVGWCPGW